MKRPVSRYSAATDAPTMRGRKIADTDIAGAQPEADKRRIEARLRRRQTNIARQRESESTAARRALHDADYRLRAAPRCQHNIAYALLLFEHVRDSFARTGGLHIL